MSQPSFGELDGQDPYDILELPSGASEAEVRAARKRLLRKYHPDLPTGDLRRTQMITAAADLLLDPFRRIGYYDLRDEESRRTVFATAEPADIWSSRAGPAWVDEPAQPKAEPVPPKAEPVPPKAEPAPPKAEPAPPKAERREATPPSGTRTDGHWFRPLGGFDGRAPRPQNPTPPTGGTGASPPAGAAPPTGTSPPAGARPAPPDSFDGFRRRGLRRRPPMYSGRWATRTGHRQAGVGEPEPRSAPGGSTGGSARPATGATAPAGQAANGRGPGIRPTFIMPPSQSEKPRPEPAGPAPRHAIVDQQPTAASRWNALAIASVVAIVTWTPLPLILGMLALGQIRRYGQRGTRLALTGVIVGGILLVVYFYLLVISR